jgi:hypothetical protein
MEVLDMMNQWEIAKNIAERNHCHDIPRCGGGRLPGHDNEVCPMYNPEGFCIVSPEVSMAECAKRWMSEHPELNPDLAHLPEIPVGNEQELDRLNRDQGKERVVDWLADSNLMLSFADELDRAEKLHPQWPKDIVYQACIVMEEAGEFMQAVMNYKFHGGSPEDVVREIQQVGAMALRFMKNLPDCENILAAIKTQREEGHE